MNIFRSLGGISKLQKRLLSPYRYAKHIGVNIGTKCFVADRHHWPSEPYLVSIGDDCAITEGVKIHTHGGGRIIRTQIQDFDCFGKVKIGNHVYIGAGSHIMPGVTIEDNVLVAAGSVVTKSIPSGYVVGGNPAKIIGTVNEYIKRNIKYNVHTKKLGAEEKKKLLESMPDDTFIQKKQMRIE